MQTNDETNGEASTSTDLAAAQQIRTVGDGAVQMGIEARMQAELLATKLRTVTIGPDHPPTKDAEVLIACRVGSSNRAPFTAAGALAADVALTQLARDYLASINVHFDDSTRMLRAGSALTPFDDFRHHLWLAAPEVMHLQPRRWVERLRDPKRHWNVLVMFSFTGVTANFPSLDEALGIIAGNQGLVCVIHGQDEMDVYDAHEALLAFRIVMQHFQLQQPLNYHNNDMPGYLFGLWSMVNAALDLLFAPNQMPNAPPGPAGVALAAALAPSPAARGADFALRVVRAHLVRRVSSVLGLARALGGRGDGGDGDRWPNGIAPLAHFRAIRQGGQVGGVAGNDESEDDDESEEDDESMMSMEDGDEDDEVAEDWEMDAVSSPRIHSEGLDFEGLSDDNEGESVADPLSQPPANQPSSPLSDPPDEDDEDEGEAEGEGE